MLTTAEITKLLEVAKVDKRTRYRNQAILLLFLDTGLRSSELARIKLHDIDWDNAQVSIQVMSQLNPKIDRLYDILYFRRMF